MTDITEAVFERDKQYLELVGVLNSCSHEYYDDILTRETHVLQIGASLPQHLQHSLDDRIAELKRQNSLAAELSDDVDYFITAVAIFTHRLSKYKQGALTANMRDAVAGGITDITDALAFTGN